MHTIVNMKLNYFNSSSARKIVEFLSVLEKIGEDGNVTKIKWYYKSHDEVMKERGEGSKNGIERTLRAENLLKPNSHNQHII